MVLLLLLLLLLLQLYGLGPVTCSNSILISETTKLLSHFIGLDRGLYGYKTWNFNIQYFRDKSEAHQPQHKVRITLIHYDCSIVTPG
jgi:hypothetical protein